MSSEEDVLHRLFKQNIISSQIGKGCFSVVPATCALANKYIDEELESVVQPFFKVKGCVGNAC